MRLPMIHNKKECWERAGIEQRHLAAVCPHNVHIKAGVLRTSSCVPSTLIQLHLCSQRDQLFTRHSPGLAERLLLLLLPPPAWQEQHDQVLNKVEGALPIRTGPTRSCTSCALVSGRSRRHPRSEPSRRTLEFWDTL
jgi:hypothetical protein